MAEPSRFNQMRLPDISCREDESDLRGRYQPLAIGSSQLGRRKPQSLRLIAGSNHAGLVDVCPLDLLFFVGILQMGYSNAPANGGVPSRGILRRSLRCKGSDRDHDRQRKKILIGRVVPLAMQIAVNVLI